MIVGDGGVGSEYCSKKHVSMFNFNSLKETCLLISFASNAFPGEHIPAALDSFSVELKADGKNYTVSLWDTAGQDDYDNIRWLSYPETDLFFICYSCFSPASFHNVKEKWVTELKYRMERPRYILVATKIDLRDDPKAIQRLADKRQTPVSTEQGMALSREIGASGFFEVSALTQKGLKELFNGAVKGAANEMERQLMPKEEVCFWIG